MQKTSKDFADLDMRLPKPHLKGEAVMQEQFDLFDTCRKGHIDEKDLRNAMYRNFMPDLAEDINTQDTRRMQSKQTSYAMLGLTPHQLLRESTKKDDVKKPE